MKIIAIGRNYAEHAKELNNPIPDEPVIFLKPDSALILKDQPFYYPDFSKDIHYEVEIVVKISQIGKNISKQFAYKYYEEIGIGIDFTARDIQQKCKSKGLPWELAKAFDGSAPLGKFINKSNFENLRNINFHLDLNGKTVQTGNTSMMLHSIDDIIAFTSSYFTLKKGDLIFTGTPAGVGPVKIGDVLIAYIEDKQLLKVEIK
jgi:2-keto-4-pentenoate hydratase/2-oxohepta-3-ene-1,7-dioic acid hydratase in catechol pathway